MAYFITWNFFAGIDQALEIIVQQRFGPGLQKGVDILFSAAEEVQVSVASSDKMVREANVLKGEAGNQFL